MSSLKRHVSGSVLNSISLCCLCALCDSVVSGCRTFIHYRDTGDKKVAQKRPQTKTLTNLPIALTLILCVFGFSACQRMPALASVKATKPAANSRVEQKSSQPQTETYGPPLTPGTLQDPAINESSGIIASRTTPGLYWTHNDSGDGPYIYALDDHGARRGTWRVRGASARDWEDIAAGPGPETGVNYLYIGDIGDNGEELGEIVVYRVKEPTIKPEDSNSSRLKPLVTEDAEAIHFRYPDGAHNAEALLVHPKTGNLYIVTKIPFANSFVYEAPAPQDATTLTTLNRIAELKIPSMFGGLVTGGDISPDGLRVALCDYVDGYELALANSRASFDEIWKQPLKPLDLGKRKQGEAIAYRLDGRALLATSEGRHSPLVEVVRR
jgi:hypothetical protein